MKYRQLKIRIEIEYDDSEEIGVCEYDSEHGKPTFNGHVKSEDVVRFTEQVMAWTDN